MADVRVAFWAGVFGRSGVGMVRHDSFGMGAALAFYTVFSLGPLLVLSAAVAGRMIGSREVRGEIVAWSEYYVGAEGAKTVKNMLASSGNATSSLTATLIGVATLFFSATGVFGRLKHSLNSIWDVDRRRQTFAVFFVITRLKATITAVIIGLALFLGIILSAMMSNVGKVLGRWLPLPESLLLSTNLVLSLCILVPLFLLIFKYLPDVSVPWRSAWSGAIVTGILFQAGALAMGAYLSTRVLSTFYGAAGSVLAVMLWAYYTVQTVLFGAEVCREHARAKEKLVPTLATRPPAAPPKPV
jgi:membrane protein